ncbi:phosphomannomutase/phosphoglucomutase [Flexivirga endophytica]|uniref:Phosphomannomutase/phosphoglucomutase n=1 Tax=Flexivirga endophytica TaxID=1849103 RepID=A0A916TF44_9MICO|nr:phosphomannomutase/phosphoglucomutase [Flexivirga endophytica]GGB41595.1 phosphomannomutase/phosphoglucomutase [Flexivirga endophytica]GHB49423.1 phosphomannomutase/phosphoglucomutase [Flexivirga endophytica]
MSGQLADLVKAYDVRGIVGEQLNADTTYALGSAFAQVVAVPERAHRVVVGHDMRPSSPALADGFATGVTAHGVVVDLIGLCSTDELYYASGALNAPGAMFTASHNPADYNGIKVCRAGARPVSIDTGLDQIRVLAEAELDHEPTQRTPTAPIELVDLLCEYAAFLRRLVELTRIRPLTVVVDAGNGMSGLTAPAVFGDIAGLPAPRLRIVPLYFELDGTFPNHPANPLDPANLLDLQAAVVHEHADLGLAFDGDADRCFVIDERGVPVSPSAITALIAARQIAQETGSGTPADEVHVVHNLICSRAVPDLIDHLGAHPIRTRVGHSFIKAEMARNNAVFGGEHSGHYYFRDFWFADTGMLAALHVIAALGGQPDPLSRLVEQYSPYAASGEINSRVSDADEVTQRIRSWASRIPHVSQDSLDGLTVCHDGASMWWLNVRSSNTEPLLRLNVEAADQRTMFRVRDAVLALIREAAPVRCG